MRKAIVKITQETITVMESPILSADFFEDVNVPYRTFHKNDLIFV